MSWGSFISILIEHFHNLGTDPDTALKKSGGSWWRYEIFCVKFFKINFKPFKKYSILFIRKYIKMSEIFFFRRWYLKPHFFRIVPLIPLKLLLLVPGPVADPLTLNEQGSGIRCCRPVIGSYVPLLKSLYICILWYCVCRRTVHIFPTFSAGPPVWSCRCISQGVLQENGLESELLRGGGGQDGGGQRECQAHHPHRGGRRASRSSNWRW